MTDERQYGPLGQRVLLDDDAVRVWELTLAPGEESGLHRHEHDYLLVIVEGDRVAAEPAPESTTFTDRIEVEVTPPQAAHLRAGGVENAINTGSIPYREFIIELKHPSA